MAHSFTPGTRVMFTGKRNETVYGTVKRVNKKSITLEQCSDGPRGWRVAPWMLSPADGNDPGVEATNAPAGERPWRKGDRVTFTGNGRTVVGTIIRVSSKTCSVQPDGEVEGRYWRVSPAFLRPATGEAVAPPPKADTTDRDKAQWERYAPMYDLPADGFGKEITVRGDTFRVTGINTRRPKYPVSILRLRDGSTRKCGADFVKAALKAVCGNPSAPAKPRRSDSEILDDITGCFCRLSPENLTCDGELSAAASRRKATAIRRELDALFTEYGKRLTEGEAWDLYEKILAA